MKKFLYILKIFVLIILLSASIAVICSAAYFTGLTALIALFIGLTGMLTFGFILATQL